MADTMMLMAEKGTSGTVRLDNDLMRMLRLICNERGISMGEYITPLIKETVKADYKVTLDKLIEERDHLGSDSSGEDAEPEPSPKPKKGKKA